MAPISVNDLKDLESKLPIPNADALSTHTPRPEFTLPESVFTKTQQLSALNPELEKRRQNIELIKWLIGSVVLVVMTTIINWNLRDREDSFKEVQEYNRYATDLIVLNNDPLKRRMLAQFFSNVIPTDRVREGWQEYYKIVDIEYKIFLAKTDSAQKQYAALEKKTTPTKQEQAKKDSLSNFIQQNQELIKNATATPLVLPAPSAVNRPPATTVLPLVSRKNPTSAAQWEMAGFNFLIQRDITNAITAFRNSDAAYPTYHQVYEISKLLLQRKDDLLDTKSSAWQAVYATIVSQLSWQMPSTIKSKLLNLIQPPQPEISKNEAVISASPTEKAPSAPTSTTKPDYGPKEFDVALGYSQRIGYYDDERRLINVALDEIDATNMSADIRISTKNERFRKNTVNESYYTLQLGQAKSFQFHGFPYKLTLTRISTNTAWFIIERYNK